MEALSQRGILDVNSSPVARTVTRSRKVLWTGRLMSGLAILFMAVDSVGKVLELAPVIQGSTELGYAASAVFGLGLIELACVVLYVIPRTSVLGAILMTGWFGGAIATHLRLGHPLFSHTLFPIYVAVLVWGGLFLRNGSLRTVLFPRVRK
jgi:DoxX-like family